MTDEPTEEQKKKDAVIVSNWAKILRYAWSTRFFVPAAFFSGLEAYISFFEASDLGVSDGAFALLAMFLTIAGFIARFFAQKNMED